MERYKKILVAVDGSESSKNALRQAIRLAQTGVCDKECSITAVAVVPPYEGDLDLLGISDTIRKMREEPCRKALSDATEIAKREGIGIKTVCTEGVVHERIVDLAESQNCDLIVIGRRGLARIERALMGSVTARVIGYTRGGVLVVPRAAKVGCKNILIATDGSRYSDAAASEAINIAKICEGNLIALSVAKKDENFPVAEESVDKVRRDAEREGIKVEGLTRKGTPYEVIIKTAEQKNADLIVVGSHGRTGIERLLMGSVTERVIGHAECAVLVVKV
ncbi:MAG: universal stress protein [Nitrospirota bacterium]